MILNGLGRLVRNYPHVPGIDFVGTVAETTHPGLAPRRRGDPDQLARRRNPLGRIRATRAGEGQLAGPLAAGHDAAARYGGGGGGSDRDAGDHAAGGPRPDPAPACGRPILVTGASGGLGSVAISILSNLGYAVAVVTGSAAQHEYLKGLGATQIVDRAALETPSGKPLSLEKWAGAVDAVGGKILSNLVTELAYGGNIACCGNAGGINLSTNVLTLLLRGVNLLGIDSVMCPIPARRTAWDRLTRELNPAHLDAMAHVVELS